MVDKLLAMLGVPEIAASTFTAAPVARIAGFAVRRGVRLPVQWTSTGGDVLTLRAARMGDASATRAFIDGLSRESRYYRFMTGARVPDAHIEAFVESETSLVVTTDVGGNETIIANAHYVAGMIDGRQEAELAVAVDDNWQGKGIGRTLVQRMIDMARHAGMDAVRGDVLSENRRMLALMRGFGFSVRRNPEDGLVHAVWMGLGNPTTRQCTRSISA